MFLKTLKNSNKNLQKNNKKKKGLKGHMWFIIVWLDLKELVDLKFRAINLDTMVVSEKKTMAQADLIFA